MQDGMFGVIKEKNTRATKKTKKCPVCGKYNSAEESHKVGERYCCPGCAEEYLKTLNQTKLVKCTRCNKSFQMKDCVMETIEKDAKGKPKKKAWVCHSCHQSFLTENSDRRKLIEYICNLFGLAEPSMHLLAQIKMLENDYGFTYKEMIDTLEYFHVIKGQVAQGSDPLEFSIGIIPHIYWEAKEFYEKRRAINEKNRAFTGPLFTHRTVKVQERPHEPRLNRRFIDISKIGESEDAE